MLITICSPTLCPNILRDRTECVASVIHKDTKSSLDISSFTTMIRLSMTNPTTAVKNRISEIDNLSDDWDGHGAVAPKKIVVKNSFKFIDSLTRIGFYNLDPDDIYPMPYGSIVIEINNNIGMVSIEIGNHSVGFFTDYVNHKNVSSEGEKTDFRSIPESLRKALYILRYGQ